MSSDDIEAINVYFNSQPAKSPQAQTAKAKWATFYNDLNFITRGLDSTFMEAMHQKDVFNAAQGAPSDLTHAADLSQDQKVSIQSAIAKSEVLSPAQKKTALAKNPTIPTTPDVSAGSITHKTIKQGSTGPDVAAWQKIIGVSADGKFGPGTAAATRAWQTKHGLTADGAVGPKTWSAATGQTVQEAPTVAAAFLPPVSPSFSPPKANQAPLISPSPAVHAAAVAKNPQPQAPVKASSGTSTPSAALKKAFNPVQAGLVISAPSVAGWFVGGPIGAAIGAGVGTLFEVFGIK